MDVQLNYQGYQIDVAIPDQNTTCEYLIDFAQNGLQSAVQILYGLPDGSTGEVDPSWPVLPLVQAGAQFQLNEIKIEQPLQTEIQQQNIIQKQNITLIVFVDNEFIMQLQAYEYQIMQDILDIINANVMIDKIITYELYHKNRNQILSKNTPSDQLKYFLTYSEPLIFMGYTKKLQSMQNLQKQQNNQQKFQISQNFDNPDCQLQLIQELFIVEKDFSLYVDAYGEVVLYKFHHPVIISGALKKCNSKVKLTFKKTNYKWINVHNVSYTVLGNYCFAIEWNNGNVSIVRIFQQ